MPRHVISTGNAGMGFHTVMVPNWKDFIVWDFSAAINVDETSKFHSSKYIISKGLVTFAGQIKMITD